MSYIYANAKVVNINNDAMSFSMPFLVDTGAIDSYIPANELEKINVTRTGKKTFELADGKIVQYDTGYAFIYVFGEKVAANVIFGAEGVEPLLGVTVLESAGLIVDPVNQTLKKIAAIPLK